MGMTRDLFSLAKRKSKLNMLLNMLIFYDKLDVIFLNKEVELMKSRIVNPMELEQRKKNVKQVYSEIDAEIERQQLSRKIKPICTAKCNACCSDYFYVSYAEFLVILDYIVENKMDLSKITAESYKQKNGLLQKYPNEYCKLDKKRTDIQITDISELYNDNDVPNGEYTCPLLCNDGNCTVYPVRTLICRYYGVDRNYNTCLTVQNRMLKGMFKRKISKKKIEKHTYQLPCIENYLVSFDKATHLGQCRQFAVAPLFWWFTILDQT